MDKPSDFYTCPAHVAMLANAALIYVIACVAYLLLTRSSGTPFSDSLTVEQRKIRASSSRVRSAAFVKGVAIGAITLMIWRPLQWKSF